MSTESFDPRYAGIDQWPTALAVEAMLEGQFAALAAVRSALPVLAGAADAAAARLGDSGRLVYVGAGTSGRIAVQDGVELLPTYNWPDERVLFLLAGGNDALIRSAEGAEDDGEAARAAIAGAAVSEADVVIGIAASGRTPYTVAALYAARERGALTVGIANNGGTPLLEACAWPLLAETGSEIIAGSTRMKAGTAQKVLVNLLSTAIMLRSGLVYRGLMVNMRVSNEKLLHRACRMVHELSGVREDVAADALKAADGDIKRAVLVASGVARDTADALLEAHGGDLRRALADWEERRG